MTFAWELGQNYGHVLGFLPTARELVQRGHCLQFLLRDLSRARRLVESRNITLYQAPMWMPQLRNSPTPLSYAELLFSAGYLDADGLCGLVDAWSNLFSAVGTELVIADHAPTALLAARISGLPAVTLGTGFTTPPPVTPLPPLCWWESSKTPAIERRMRDSESVALTTVNTVLTAGGAEPLDKLADLFAVAGQFLCTFPELDHYPGRINADYQAPRFSADEGIEPVWPASGKSRVFAYLDPGNRFFAPLLKCLAESPVTSLVHAPGLPVDRARSMSSASVHVTPELVRMDSARAECDVALCHGGMGTVSAMLIGGKPILVAPTQIEQTVTARNIEKAGLGLAIREDFSRYPPAGLIRRLIEDPGYRKRTEAFAARYAHHSPQRTVQQIADRCETITRAAA